MEITFYKMRILSKGNIALIEYLQNSSNDYQVSKNEFTGPTLQPGNSINTAVSTSIEKQDDCSGKNKSDS